MWQAPHLSAFFGNPQGRIQHKKYYDTYSGADKSLAGPRRKQATATADFDFHNILFIIIIGGILVLFIYITRLASKEMFSPSK
jgi:hypothetical protein